MHRRAAQSFILFSSLSILYPLQLSMTKPPHLCLPPFLAYDPPLAAPSHASVLESETDSKRMPNLGQEGLTLPCCHHRERAPSRRQCHQSKEGLINLGWKENLLIVKVHKGNKMEHKWEEIRGNEMEFQLSTTEQNLWGKSSRTQHTTLVKAHSGACYLACYPLVTHPCSPNSLQTLERLKIFDTTPIWKTNYGYSKSWQSTCL